MEAGTRTDGGTDGEHPDLRRLSIPDLIRQVGRDSVTLLRQEIALAQIELKENATDVGLDFTRLLVWIAVAWLGVMSLTACLVLVVANLLEGAYWLGALVVGGVFALVGGLLALRAGRDLKKRNLAPEKTVGSLKQDREWAGREAGEFKRQLTS